MNLDKILDRLHIFVQESFGFLFSKLFSYDVICLLV